MKNTDTKKITTLGVVIFSFISIAMCMMIVMVLDTIIALLVAKTPVPEGFLKIGNVISTGASLIISAMFLTVKGRMKGIVSAGVLSAGIIVIKVIGNSLMGMGGYLNLNGLVGTILVIVFSLVGGILGSMLKR